MVALTVSPRPSTHPVVCEKCGEAQIAPEWAEYFGEEGLILYLWACPRCGNRFETEAPAPAEEKEADKHITEDFFTSLLVA